MIKIAKPTVTHAVTGYWFYVNIPNNGLSPSPVFDQLNFFGYFHLMFTLQKSAFPLNHPAREIDLTYIFNFKNVI